MPSQTVIKRSPPSAAYIDERGGVGIRLKPAADDCGSLHLWTDFIRLIRQLLLIEPERLGIGPLGFGMPQAMPVKRRQPVPDHRQVRLLGRPPLRHHILRRRRWWRGRQCWRWRWRQRRHHDDRHGRWWQSGNQMGGDRNLTGGRHPQQHRPGQGNERHGIRRRCPNGSGAWVRTAVVAGRMAATVPAAVPAARACPATQKTPGANCSVDDFAIGEVLPGPAVDSCQTLTQACDLDDNPGSDETPVRSRFLAVH